MPCYIICTSVHANEIWAEQNLLTIHSCGLLVPDCIGSSNTTDSHVTIRHESHGQNARHPLTSTNYSQLWTACLSHRLEYCINASCIALLNTVFTTDSHVELDSKSQMCLGNQGRQTSPDILTLVQGLSHVHICVYGTMYLPLVCTSSHLNHNLLLKYKTKGPLMKQDLLINHSQLGYSSSNMIVFCIQSWTFTPCQKFCTSVIYSYIFFERMKSVYRI